MHTRAHARVPGPTHAHAHLTLARAHVSNAGHPHRRRIGGSRGERPRGVRRRRELRVRGRRQAGQVRGARPTRTQAHASALVRRRMRAHAHLTHAHTHSHTHRHTHTQAVRLRRGRAQGGGRGPLGRRAAREDLPRPADHRQRGRRGGSLPVGQQGGVSVVACVRVCVCREIHTHVDVHTCGHTRVRIHTHTRADARALALSRGNARRVMHGGDAERACACVYTCARMHKRTDAHRHTHSLRRLPRASQRPPRRGWRALPPSASPRRSRHARRRIPPQATPPRAPWRPRRRGTRRWA